MGILLPLNDTMCAMLMGKKSEVLYTAVSSWFNVTSRAVLIFLPLILQLCQNDGKLMLGVMSAMIIFNLISSHGLRGPRVKTGLD